MKNTFIGGVIGLCIGLLCLVLGSLLVPVLILFYITYIFGFDFFIMILDLQYQNFEIFFGIAILVLMGISIGLFYDKQVSKKSKKYFYLILLVVILILSGFSNLTKYQDSKLIVANKSPLVMIDEEGRTLGTYYPTIMHPHVGVWNVTDKEICNKITSFNKNERTECLESIN